MDEQYLQQAQRLEELRRRPLSQGSGGDSYMIKHEDSGESNSSGGKLVDTPGSSLHESDSLKDPLIYPGLYAPSGFDMMGILVRVRTRPDPIIDIGSIDDSVALCLCDAEHPDLPIVYCSEPFETLTGYSAREILGRNCRFLQHPPSDRAVKLSASQQRDIRTTNEKARAELQGCIVRATEAQVKLVNFRRDGTIFVNILTMIPIMWEGEAQGSNRMYMVGFQVDAQRRLHV